MATDWKVWGLNLRRGKRFLSSQIRPDRPWGPTGPLFNGYGASLPRIKPTGRDVEHLLASVANVKTHWRYVSSLPIRLLDVDRNNFVCTFNFDLLGCKYEQEERRCHEECVLVA